MTDVRVVAEYDRCIASGSCVMESPTVFDQDEDGVVLVLVDRPSSEQLPSVQNAVRACPAAVLELHDE